MELIGIGAETKPSDGSFAAGALPPSAGGGGTARTPSGFAALLEITNRRRVGGVLALISFEAVTWALRGADWGAVALRFNIKYIQTKKAAPVQNNFHPPLHGGF
jgi:hypothetical protein